ncbi:MAG: SRPBCC domain-containing protein [Aestuariivirga sp.]
MQINRTSTEYSRAIAIKAPIERAFEAIATIKGVQGWWTPLVTGTSKKGGALRLEFEGMDEHIDMRVTGLQRPSEVTWLIVEHSSLDEWAGTTIHFKLLPMGANKCKLEFRHEGLSPKLTCYDHCETGWDYFLSSLVALAEHGKGHPFGSG